jgi:hypothetical protein
MSSGVGSPACFYLDIFGRMVWDVFGHPPYLVGSATISKKWRDVDVRLILDDDEFADMFGATWTTGMMRHPKWVAMCAAYSALGTRVTGLNVDFQIQQQTTANDAFTGQRHALGLHAPGNWSWVEHDEEDDP